MNFVIWEPVSVYGPVRTPQMYADLTVFAKDYPEIRLVVEVKLAVTSPPEKDPATEQIRRYMWGANCHYGLIVTPARTYVLRDDFTAHGPEAIRVSQVISTPTLLGRLGRNAAEITSELQLRLLVQEWLQLLALSYEAALPDDPEVINALFPEIVGAVAEGRVEAEVRER